MSDELLPCPFCGGEAKRSEETYGVTLMSWVYCTSCGAQGAPRHIEAEAIDMWNTRVERTCRNEDYDHDTWFKCSECRIRSNLEIMHGGCAIPSYCPNCGAKVEQ